MTGRYTVRAPSSPDVFTICRDGVPVASLHTGRLPFGVDIAVRVAGLLAECEAENTADEAPTLNFHLYNRDGSPVTDEQAEAIGASVRAGLMDPAVRGRL